MYTVSTMLLRIRLKSESTRSNITELEIVAIIFVLWSRLAVRDKIAYSCQKTIPL
jgi:hypothetical protein